jgi:hypothetical protein
MTPLNNSTTQSNHIMKNKTGVLTGFILGVTGFLLLFKIIILDRVSPDDELAPGIVVIASIMSGALFAFVGYLIQNSFERKRN